MQTQPAKGMQVRELLALPAAIDLMTAARALQIGRTTAYDLARRDAFPLPLLKLGAQYRVRRVDLLAYLGVEQAA